MGRVGAFLHTERVGHGLRPASESLNDFEEFALPLTLEEQCEQASRCMNCGVAFCQTGVALGDSLHAVGCPLHNLIPETNDLLYQHRFEDAVARVALTNPFPEFTGRVCPAPCEVACNLGLHKAPVTINDNERALSDIAWENGIDPLPPCRRCAACKRDRLGASGSGMRLGDGATRMARAHLRTGRSSWWPAHVWHSQHEASEVDHRASGELDA